MKKKTTSKAARHNARTEARALPRQNEAAAQAALISDPLLRLPAVRLATGYSTSSLYQFMQEGRFPKPVKFGAASLWPKSHIEAWLAAVRSGEQWRSPASS